MKKSVRNAITPNLNAVYEQEHEQAINIDAEQHKDDVTFSEECNELHQMDHDGLDANFNHNHIVPSMSVLDECANIDDAMRSLYVTYPPLDHTIITHGHDRDRDHDPDAQLDSQTKDNHIPSHDRLHNNQGNIQTRLHPYDWLLDGNPISELQIPLQEPLTNFPNNLSPKNDCVNEADTLGSESDENRGQLECALSGLELEALSSTASDDNTLQMMEGFRSLLVPSYSNEGIDSQCINSFSWGEVKREGCERQLSLEVGSTPSSCDTYSLEREGLGTDLMREESTFPAKNLFRDLRNDHSWMESWNAVPDDLPFQDPSTPEGNFIRRVQVDRDRDNDNGNASSNNSSRAEIDMEIPPVYFDENRDAVLELLESMPWEDESEESTELHGSMDQDSYLVERLSSLDELSQTVTTVLLQHVKQREDQIQREMKRVQGVDYDITSALSYSRQAATYLQRARGQDEKHGGSRAGALAGNYVIEEADQRDRLRQVDDLIKSIQDLSVMEATVFDFVDNFAANLMSDRDGIATLLETCEILKNRLLREERFLKLSCLDESRERVSHIMEYLCQRIEEELMLFLFRRCKLDSTVDNWNHKLMNEYNTLLDARIVFDDYRLQEAKTNDIGDAKDDTTKHDFVSQWSSIVFDALCFEAERSLPKALLDPTVTNNSDPEGPSDFDSNLCEIRSKVDEIQCFGQDAASLRSLTNNLFSIRLEFGQNDPNLVGMFHKLCSLLANVLHVHHKLCQWHQEQVDAADIRCVTLTNDNDSSQNMRVERLDIAVAKDDTTKSTLSSNCSRSSSISQPIHQRGTNPSDFTAIPQCISGPQDEGERISTKLSMKKIESFQEAIFNKRRDLWLHCKIILVKFLDTVLISKEDKETTNWSLTWRQDLESLSDIYTLCDQMNQLGRTFLWSEDANYAIPLDDKSETECELKEALFRLCENFINGAHVEAMTEVGTMMASETWDLLPIPLQKKAQNDPSITIQSSIHSFLSGVETSLCTSPSTQANAQVWHNRLSRNKDDTFLELFADGENPFTEVEVTVGECDDAFNIAGMPSKPNFFDDVENLGPYRRQLHEKTLSYTSNSDNELALASKSALNGLARWSLRLVSIEAKLPIASMQIGAVLCNLYDLYFLTVFRLCAGNSGGEGIILGNDRRSDYGFQERFPQDISPPIPHTRGVHLKRTNSFSRRRSTSSEISQGAPSRLINVLVSRYCDADINAPLASDEEAIARARAFIFRGQAALSTMVSLDQIERWALCHDEFSRKDEMLYTAKCMETLFAASSSCLFVACLFESCIHKMNLTVEDVKSRAYSPLFKYYKQMMGAMSVMHHISMQMCGTRAIMGSRVVSNVSTHQSWQGADTICNNSSNILKSIDCNSWTGLGRVQTEGTLQHVHRYSFRSIYHTVGSPFIFTFSQLGRSAT